MPTITVAMLAGRSFQQKEALTREVTEAVVRTLGVEHERVRVTIVESSAGAPGALTIGDEGTGRY